MQSLLAAPFTSVKVVFFFSAGVTLSQIYLPLLTSLLLVLRAQRRVASLIASSSECCASSGLVILWLQVQIFSSATCLKFNSLKLKINVPREHSRVQHEERCASNHAVDGSSPMKGGDVRALIVPQLSFFLNSST